MKRINWIVIFLLYLILDQATCYLYLDKMENRFVGHTEVVSKSPLALHSLGDIEKINHSSPFFSSQLDIGHFALIFVSCKNKMRLLIKEPWNVIRIKNVLVKYHHHICHHGHQTGSRRQELDMCLQNY